MGQKDEDSLEAEFESEVTRRLYQPHYSPKSLWRALGMTLGIWILYALTMLLALRSVPN